MTAVAMLDKDTDDTTLPNPKNVRGYFLFSKGNLSALVDKNTKAIKNLSKSNVQRLKRNWHLFKLLEVIQAGAVTVNTRSAFQSVADGGYWPVDTPLLAILGKAVDNYGNNPHTIKQIETYVRGNVQDLIDFVFEPAKKTRARKAATLLQTALDLPCPGGCDRTARVPPQNRATNYDCARSSALPSGRAIPSSSRVRRISTTKTTTTTTTTTRVTTRRTTTRVRTTTTTPTKSSNTD
jgi:hypothetical protein